MACPDADVLARYVEGLLSADDAAALDAHADACPDCRMLVAVLTASPTEGAGSETPADPGPASKRHDGPLPRGTALGRYLIVEPVGMGGMGVVYRAYDPELDRRVAIKLVRLDRSERRSDARLLREARVMARLTHPNVLPIYDVGLFRDQVFLAMEYVDGATLSAWLREEKRRDEAIVRVMRAAGEGLSAAHDAGLVHRDFKPDNVLIGRDGRVRVTDFGLARVTPLAGGECPAHAIEAPRGGAPPDALTVSGVLLGTPAYMAPEQHDRLPADARTDQFAFCVALYEALYGERPFRATTMEELAAAARRGWGAVKPPLGQKIPARLELILRRGLMPFPEDRYPSMRDLLGELERVAQPRFSRAGAAIAVLGAVTLAMGIAVWRGQSDPARACERGASAVEKTWGPEARARVNKALSDTNKPYAQATWEIVSRALDARARDWKESYLAACAATHRRGEQSGTLLDLRLGCLSLREAETSVLIGELGRADATTMEHAAEATLGLLPVAACSDTRSLLDRGPPAPEPRARDRVQAIRGELERIRVLTLLGRFNEAIEPASKAALEARALGYRPLEAEAHYRFGRAKRRLVDLKGATEALHEAIWAAEAGRHDEVAADAWMDLLEVTSLADKEDTPAQVSRVSRHAEAAVERAGGDRKRRALLLGQRAAAQLELRKAAEALPLAEQSLELLQAVHGGDHPEVASGMNLLASVLNKLQRRDEAAAYFRRALEMSERLYGPEHPSVAMLMTNYGMALQLRPSMLLEAERLHRRALDIDMRALGPAHPSLAIMRANLAHVLVELDRAKEAVPLFEAAVEAHAASLGEAHTHTLMTRDQLGLSLAFAGRADEGVRELSRNITLCEGTAGREHLLWRSLLWASQAALVAQDAADAERFARRAVKVTEEMKPPGTLGIPSAHLGLALLRLHRDEEAIEMLIRADRESSRDMPYVRRGVLAEGRLALARVLWDRKGQRELALSAAQRAQSDLAEAPPRYDALRREVSLWLDAHEGKGR